MEHYVVRIGKDGNVFYASSWWSINLWLNQKTGEIFENQKEIEEYNKLHTKKIELETHEIREYFSARKTYAMQVRICEDLAWRVKKLKKSPKRDRLFGRFAAAYDKANEICYICESVWQGEI